MEHFQETMRRIIERQIVADRDGPSATAQVVAGQRTQRDLELAEDDRERRWREAGIPRGLWPAIGAPDETEALAAARAFLDSDSRFLVLAGDTGRGKTTAAAWAVSERRGRYLYATDLATAGIYAEAFWDDARFASLLAVDELGRERGDEKGWYESALLRLLIGRCDDARKTVLCANVDLGAFRLRYTPAAHEALGKGMPEAEARRADALYDRLKAYGRFVVLRGPTLRIAT